MKTTLLLLALVCGLSACQIAAEKQIGLHVPIRHDDFMYSVQRVTRQDHIGPLKPAGQFWIVTFRVDNQAVRVGHDWANTTAFVIDGTRTYENRTDAQRRLNQLEPFGWQPAYHTPAGQTDSTRLVFDLPASVRKPFLQVRGEWLMGDALDGNQFERTKVRLF